MGKNNSETRPIKITINRTQRLKSEYKEETLQVAAIKQSLTTSAWNKRKRIKTMGLLIKAKKHILLNRKTAGLWITHEETQKLKTQGRRPKINR